jgi:transposase
MREPIPIVANHVDLAAENAALRAENVQLRAVIVELRGVVDDLRKTVESQQNHIHKLVKMTFGRGGERVEGPTLFDAMTPPEAAPAILDATPEPIAWTPKRRGHGRLPKPADLPRRREELDLAESEKPCPCCGTLRIRIGTSIHERLDYEPASLFVRELVRPTYACRRCEPAGDANIVKAPLPPQPIPKSGIGAGLLAHVIVAKFVDHLPLHRQERILARHGLDVRRSTLCDHLHRCGELLTPLYDLLRERLVRSFALHADDTPLVLLRPKRTAYAWVYLGDAANPVTLFDLTPGRKQEFPSLFLRGYTGFVHADAYVGYHPVHAHTRHLGCWMHARRKFVDAQDNDPRAVEALAFIRTLYAVEKDLKIQRDTRGDRFPDAEFAAERQARAGPILAQFGDWLEEHHRTTPPKTLLGQALDYTRNQWSTLTRYATDARFAIDNGAAERAIRPLTVGRANWLHIGGDTGLKTAAVLLSICATAVRNGFEPWRYLTTTLDALAHNPADLTSLLPIRN